MRTFEFALQQLDETGHIKKETFNNLKTVEVKGETYRDAFDKVLEENPGYRVYTGTEVIPPGEIKSAKERVLKNNDITTKSVTVDSITTFEVDKILTQVKPLTNLMLFVMNKGINEFIAMFKYAMDGRATYMSDDVIKEDYFYPARNNFISFFFNIDKETRAAMIKYADDSYER